MQEGESQRIVELRRQMVRSQLNHWVTGRHHDVWSPVFERVPRHVFLPRLRSLSKGTLLDEADPQQRDTWLECAYTGMLVCLPDDHAPVTLCRLRIGDLANLFEHAGIAEGHRVLVVGAGQGYVPALLCERLGDSHVTVTDPDAGSLDEVVTRLRAAGYQPTAASDPAEDGHPANAPYDCIITNRTRDTLEIPPAWIAQVKPGGKVLAVLSSTQVIVLDVHEDKTAEGQFLGDTPFIASWMPPPWAAPAQRSDWPEPLYERRITTVSPKVCDSRPDFRLHIRLNIGEVATESGGMHGSYNASVRHRDGSWANIHNDEHGTWHVTEGGLRKLWTEIETLYDQWRALGEPDLTTYHLTVTPESQTISINSVDSP